MALIELENESPNQARIKVVGVGGGGGNAINTMIASGLECVDFIAANTDLQALESNLAPDKVQLGANLTRGLGAGASPERGRASAEEDIDQIRNTLEGADMVFITAGMGGGTGTGAAPILSRVAKEAGALTVGVVTKPFRFEGKKRLRQADEGIAALKDAVDTLIVIPNERLLSVAGQATTMLDAFRKVDDVLLNAVQGISDLVVIHGFINVDFADVRTVMTDMGHALMGTGYGAGDRKALEAAQQAISSPLLEDATIDGATGILINITGGPDLTLAEINEAASEIHEAAHEDANIIFGSVIDANMEDQVRITVIATGFEHQQSQQRAAQRQRPQVITTVQQPQLHAGQGQPAQPAAEPAYAAATTPTAPAQTRAASAARTQPGPAPITAQPLQPTVTPTEEVVVAQPQEAPFSERQAAHDLGGAHFDCNAQPQVAEPTPQAQPEVATPQQTTLPYPEMTADSPTDPRHRRTSGSHLTVPRIHPNLEQVPDEHEIDIPTFLRRQPGHPTR